MAEGEANLLERARQGDQVAFAELANRHWDRLYHISYMMLHDRQGAEDVVQESLARAIKGFADFRGAAELFTWACSIVINQCRWKLRSERTRAAAIEPRLADLAQPGGRRRGPATSAVMHEVHQRAAVAVAGLATPLREAFVLHYVEELSYDIVARICGISEGAARLRALRARQSLKEELTYLLDPEIRRRIEREGHGAAQAG